MKKALFLCVLFFSIFSCDSGDELFGPNRSNPTPTGINEIDRWAPFYHNLKEAVCLDNLDDFLEVNAGWMDCGFLVQRGDSLFTISQTQKIKFSLSQGNQSLNRGASSRSNTSHITYVNRFGYRENLLLEKCNVADEYFYIFQQKSDHIAISGAFSVASLPNAWELAQEWQLLSTDRIIGLIFEEGQTPAPTLKDALGNTLYGAYLLRQNGCQRGWPYVGTGAKDDSRAIDCGGVTANGGKVRYSWTILDHRICGIVQNSIGLYNDNSDIIARVAQERWQTGDPLRVSMYSKDSVLVHQYDGYAQGTSVPNGEVRVYLAQ